MAQSISNEFKEYLLSINEFVQPKVLKGESAAYTAILRLFLLGIDLVIVQISLDYKQK